MISKIKKVAIVGIQGVPAHYGGFETLVENLIKQNNDKNIEYTVFCSKYDLPTHLKTYEKARLKYLFLHSNGIESIFYDFFAMLRAVKGYDTILILGISGCIFIPVIKLFSSAKLVVNIDGLEYKRKKWNRSARWFLHLSEKVAVRFADTVVADNKGIQDYVIGTYHKNPKLIAYGGDHVLVNVPEEEQVACLKRYGLSKNGYALTVCRIEPENNIDMILDVFAGSPDKIVIVGNLQVSPYSRKLVQQYSRYNNILLIDAVYDKVSLYILRHNAGYYVHGHSAGGTNPSLVEAMFFGRPILAYDVLYNRVTTFEQAKYFANKEELKILITQTKGMNGVLLQQMAAERYTWQIITRQYEELY